MLASSRPKANDKNLPKLSRQYTFDENQPCTYNFLKELFEED